jgi:hypothetical protein
VVSNSAQVTVNPPLAAPSITLQPVGVTGDFGQAVSLMVLSEANPSPSYQWYFVHPKSNIEQLMDRETSPSLQLKLDQWSKRGRYRVKVFNSVGTVFSIDATVDIRPVNLPWNLDRTGFFEL